MPEGTANTVVTSLKISEDDAEAINKAVKKAEDEKPEWMRDALRRQAATPPVWIKSKWTWEDLQDKTVQFRLISPKWRIEGIGKFLMRINPASEVAIEICAIKSATLAEVVEMRFYLYQKVADKIERHPDPTIADFRLLM